MVPVIALLLSLGGFVLHLEGTVRNNKRVRLFGAILSIAGIVLLGIAMLNSC